MQLVRDVQTLESKLSVWLFLQYYTLIMSWYNRVLSKLEKKGFTAANKGHKMFINLLLVGIAYQTYAFFREYNDFFIDAREVKQKTE